MKPFLDILLFYLFAYGCLCDGKTVRKSKQVHKRAHKEKWAQVNNITAAKKVKARRTYKLPKHFMQSGEIGLIPKYSVHGAIITSASDRVARFENSTSGTDLASKKHHLTRARYNNLIHLQHSLPFRLTEWSAVFTHPCPAYPAGHRTERGLVWAHYMIIREFAFFDQNLLARAQKNSLNSSLLVENTPLRAKSGLYIAYPNGTLIKNNQPFLDDDIITIFEDDAEGAIPDINMNTTLVEEFSSMGVDLLFLGWCEGRAARPVPLCAHAYALTRRGAHKLVNILEPCGRALDEQFVILAKNQLISWRRAHDYSYKQRNEKYSNLHGVKTFGIFHQNKALGSINGH